MKFSMLYGILIMVASAIILSASRPVSQDDTRKKDDLKNRKLDILEKLEHGQKITSDGIRSIHDDFYSDDFLSGPFFKYGCHNEDLDICDMDFSALRENLSVNIGELKKEIEAFRNSEDFSNMQEEFRKWGDDFKKEIENLKEDIFKSKGGTKDKEL